MDNDARIHDLTMLILEKTASDYTPEAVVNAYEELKPKVTEAYRNHPNNKPKKACTFSRAELGI